MFYPNAGCEGDDSTVYVGLTGAALHNSKTCLELVISQASLVAVVMQHHNPRRPPEPCCWPPGPSAGCITVMHPHEEGSKHKNIAAQTAATAAWCGKCNRNDMQSKAEQGICNIAVSITSSTHTTIVCTTCHSMADTHNKATATFKHVDSPRRTVDTSYMNKMLPLGPRLSAHWCKESEPHGHTAQHSTAQQRIAHCWQQWPVMLVPCSSAAGINLTVPWLSTHHAAATLLACFECILAAQRNSTL